MVVKSKMDVGHLGDLAKTFKVLQAYKLRLIASKCQFNMGI